MMFYSFVKNFLKIFYLILFRVEVVGEENIPDCGSVVICPNHKSNNDAVLITFLIKRRLTYLAKEELFRFPPLSWLLGALGAFPIKRGSGDIGAVKKAIEVLKEDKALIIFPEGRRNKTGEMLLEFKSGASLIAYKAQSPIVPCAIIGNYRLFSKMKVIFGKPVNTVYENKPDLHILTQSIENSVRGMMEENK